ncbi:MAG: zf-HC2 domain-containing protein [Bryobacter sp.]|jgi:anti-sigma factor RsiW|nr:zf-HC2 domain-containing protein [Bryobacter sp.]
MDCKTIFSLLSQYIDGELPPDACREIEAHMHDCAPCVEFLESLRKSVSLNQGLTASEPLPPLPNDFRDRLFSAWKDAAKHAG